MIVIELYQLRWSHYVEKVRWALDYKQLDWRSIDIVAFNKRDMQRFDCAQTVPLIHDTASGVAISDSSPIIRYLDETYPQRALFPADPLEREATWQWMLRLDSTLGLHARRLGYTQLIMECPRLLSMLFMANVWGGLFTRPGLRALAAPVLGGMLALRFGFHRNRQDRIYERLEAQLLPIARQLARVPFLVGERFTAGDLTLASLLRPLRIVPYFRLHPVLKSLFQWQEQLFQAHSRDVEFAYEGAIRRQRERRGRMTGRVRWMQAGRAATELPEEPSTLQKAHNDIRPLSYWKLPLGLPVYIGLRWFAGVGTMRWTPAVFG
jgi:glutathione S-transferase